MTHLDVSVSSLKGMGLILPSMPCIRAPIFKRLAQTYVLI